MHEHVAKQPTLYSSNSPKPLQRAVVFAESLYSTLDRYKLTAFLASPPAVICNTTTSQKHRSGATALLLQETKLLNSAGPQFFGSTDANAMPFSQRSTPFLHQIDGYECLGKINSSYFVNSDLPKGFVWRSRRS